jgi:FkbM family methyltransferase
MLPKIELVETKIGSLLLFQTEDFISQALRKNGSWAELESSIAILMAKNTGPSFILDIGANLGLFSYYSVLKGAKRVYAFEPGESQFKAIEDNFGSMYNLVIEKKAVTEKNGILKFAKHKTKSVMSGVFNDVDEENYSVVECQSINLMDYCLEKNISKINFLKIDCEGSEYGIFENFSEDFLKIIDKIIMEYHLNTDGRLVKMIEKLQNNGFTVNVPDVNSEIGILVAYQKVKN